MIISIEIKQLQPKEERELTFEVLPSLVWPEWVDNIRFTERKRIMYDPWSVVTYPLTYQSTYLTWSIKVKERELRSVIREESLNINRQIYQENSEKLLLGQKSSGLRSRYGLNVIYRLFSTGIQQILFENGYSVRQGSRVRRRLSWDLSTKVCISQSYHLNKCLCLTSRKDEGWARYESRNHSRR